MSFQSSINISSAYSLPVKTPLVETNQSSQFVSLVSDLVQMMHDLINRKIKINLSLSELGKMHQLQYLMQQFHFLNIIYTDQSKIRKTLGQRSSDNLKTQQKVEETIQLKFNNLLNYLEEFDNLRVICLAQQSPSIINQIIETALGTSQFIILEESKSNELKLYCNNKIAFPKENERELMDFLQSESERSQNQKLDLSQKFKEFGNQAYHAVKLINPQVDINVVYFLIQNNNNNFSFVLENCLDQQEIQKLISPLFEIFTFSTKGIIQIENIQQIIRSYKNFFTASGPIFCKRILQQSMKNILQTDVNIIEQNNEKFVNYTQNQMNELVIDKSKVAFAVKQDANINFFCEIFNCQIDIITFSNFIRTQWERIIEKLRIFRHNELTYQLLEATSPKQYFLVLNQKYEIVYLNNQFPQAWNVFHNQTMQLKCEKQNSGQMIKNEELFKMVQNSINEIVLNNKNAIDCGNIKLGDKQISIKIFSDRNSNNILNTFYVFLKPMDKRLSNSNEYKEYTENEKNMRRIDKIISSLKIKIKPQDAINLIISNNNNKPLIDTKQYRNSIVMEYYRNTSFNETPDDGKNQKNLLMKKKSMAVNLKHGQPSVQFIMEQTFAELEKENLFQVQLDDIAKLNNFNFDITMELKEDRKFELIYEMFASINFIELIDCDQQTFIQMLKKLKDLYEKNNNPFHNFEHAFTVTHCSYYYIKMIGLSDYLDNNEQNALMLSSLAHDVAHTGRTNAFEISSQSNLAICYNDESVLENYHASQFFTLLQKEECDIFSNLDDQTFRIYRKLIVSNILYTDMKKHFDLIQKTEVKLIDFNNQRFKEQDKLLFSGILIHSADLSHTSKQFDIAQKWSLRISKEFHSQVEEEKKLELPITNYLVGLDKLKNIATQEVGFIKIIILPLFEQLNIILKDGCRQQLQNLNNNLLEWEKIKNECEK